MRRSGSFIASPRLPIVAENRAGENLDFLFLRTLQLVRSSQGTRECGRTGHAVATRSLQPKGQLPSAHP